MFESFKFWYNLFMKKILLQFDYSLNYEKENIEYSIGKSDWFIENGYSKRIKLPENIKLEDVDKNKPIDYLFENAEKEYNQENYSKVEDIVTEQWLEFSPKLEQYFEETSLVPEDLYLIQLTRYGVGGSYNLPNKVIVNFQGKFGTRVLKTIIHEIVHLSIQQFIDKYNIEHWEKEWVVDLILSKIVPEINKIRDLSIDTKTIDESFNKNYPDIEKIIKNLIV